MTYPAVPDRRMPYDADGTVVAEGGLYSAGIQAYYSGTTLKNLNDYVDHGQQSGNYGVSDITVWSFFPGEQREVTAAFFGMTGAMNTPVIEGSNDTTNGVDGTWETASCTPNAANLNAAQVLDGWRKAIFTISFTGPKAVVRIRFTTSGGLPILEQLHIYGQKASGQTPDDLLFLDSDDGGAEFSSVEDFGDRPLGTTVTRQFKVQNSSTTKTANSINIQCNDSDFAISTDGVTWVVTINIASLAPGVSSSVMYVKNTTPNPGALLGPRFARITAIVGSWT